MTEMPGELADAMTSALPFMNEIDSRSLAEAVLTPKPEIDPMPHSFVHGGTYYISKDGQLWKAPLWGER